MARPPQKKIHFSHPEKLSGMLGLAPGDVAGFHEINLDLVIYLYAEKCFVAVALDPCDAHPYVVVKEVFNPSLGERATTIFFAPVRVFPIELRPA